MKEIKILQKFNVAILLIMSLWIAFYLGQNVFNLPLKYNDFIAGDSAFSDGRKFGDLLTLPLICFLSLLILFLARKFFILLNQKSSYKESYKFSLYLLFFSLPLVGILCNFILNKGYDAQIIIISIASTLTFFFSAFFLLLKNKKLESKNLALIIVSFILLNFIPVFLAIFINRMPISLHENYFSLPKIKEIVKYLSWILSATYLILLIKNYEFLNKNIRKLILLAQILLPLAFFSLYPSRLFDIDGNLFKYDTSLLLKILIIILVIYSFFDIFNRYKKTKNLQELFSPFAFLALFIAFRFGTTSLPIISPDDYHFGEKLLGFWNFHRLPYIEYFPAHGFIQDELAGIFNNIFFDSTASCMNEANRLATVFLLSIIFFSSYYFTKKNLLFAFILTFFASNLSFIYLWLFPFVSLFFYPKLIENQKKWITYFLLFSPIIILGIPPQGLILVASLGIFILYFIFEIFKNKTFSSLKFPFLTAILLFTFYCFTIFGQMLYKALIYVLSNGATNQVVWGIEWQLTWLRNGYIFEILKMSWILLPFIAIVMFYKYRNKKLALLPLLSVALFSIGMISYSMGRIDPGFSRAGTISYVSLVLLFPLSIFYFVKKTKRFYLLFFIVTIGSIFSFNRFTLNSLYNSSLTFINTHKITDMRKTDLFKFGKGQIDINQIKRLENINEILNKYLNKNESYIDLTSRNAQYFYLNKKPLVLISSMTNTVNQKEQDQAIKILEKTKVKIALLSPNTTIGTLGLRTNAIFKYILDNYYPIELNGTVFAFRKNLFKNGTFKDIKIPDNKTIIELADKVLTTKHYRKLPISWGRSFKTLRKNKLQKVANLQELESSLNQINKINQKYFVDGIDPFVVFNLEDLNISGKNSGILSFDFKCNKQKENPIIQIFWYGDNDKYFFEKASIRFNAENGRLLVPLDAQAQYYLLNKIHKVRIDLDNAKACESFEIDNLKLYKRI